MSRAGAVATYSAALLLIVSTCSNSGGHASARSTWLVTTLSAAGEGGIPGIQSAPPQTAIALQRIRQQYAEIRNRRKSFRTVKRDPGDFSTEGGALRAFFDGDKLKLIEATLYGESGQAYREFYYDDTGHVFFVFERESRYDKPLSGRSSSREYRYYFDRERLIRLLDGARQVSPDDAAYASRIPELLKLSRLLTDAVR